MSENKPKFFDQVAGAFVAATVAFLPGFFLASTSGGFSGHVHPLSWLDQLSGTVGYILAIVLAAVFLVAYPVERWLVRSGQSVWRIGGTYAMFFGILGLLLGIASLVLGDFNYMMIAMFAAPVAAITAFFGRAIYSFISKFRKTNRVIASTLALLIALPLALPDYSAMSYRVSDFYPVTQPGEISRGTWDVNEVDGSAGSHFSNTGLQTATNVEYMILWDCERKENQKYRIDIQESGYKFSEEIVVVCSANHETTVSVGTDIANESVKVMIVPIYGNEQTVDSDAYAILVPAT